MQIQSQLILTSKSAVTGVSLYTFVLTYPRVILAEVNTHRALSRNTASSRAIPAKKQRSRVLAAGAVAGDAHHCNGILLCEPPLDPTCVFHSCN